MASLERPLGRPRGRRNNIVVDRKTHIFGQAAHERIETEALAWIAQISGDRFTEKDLAAFREWVQRSPAHEKEIKDISALWGEMNVLTELNAHIGEADRLARRLRRRERRGKRLAFRAALAVLCACIVIGMTLGGGSEVETPYASSSDNVVQTAIVNVPVVFKSAVGEQQIHTLPDGSVITLNTNSHIDVDFTDHQRTVRLLKGEALFTVAKDQFRPFVVVADNGIIRAIGTEFSVRLLSASVDVVVSEGVVELSALEPTLPMSSKVAALTEDVSHTTSLGVIRAGQTATISSSKATVALHPVAEIETKLAWKSGRLEFLGKPLEDVIKEVGRYTDLDIVIDEPELQSLSFGGAFMVGDTDLLFRTLESQYGISAIFSNDNKSVRLVGPQ